MLFCLYINTVKKHNQEKNVIKTEKIMNLCEIILKNRSKKQKNKYYHLKTNKNGQFKIY